MPLEAIKSICLAEEGARQATFYTRQNAQEAIDKTLKAGQDAVARSLALADNEIVHLTRSIDKRATEQALELASKTANRQATLRARAERRLDAAVALIVERIVKV